MAGRRYNLDGIPNDLLSTEQYDVRRLKVETQTGLPSNVSFTYNANGDINTVTTIDTATGVTRVKTFSYDVNFNLTSITTEEL